MAAVTPEIVGRNSKSRLTIRQLVESKLAGRRPPLRRSQRPGHARGREVPNICEILIVGKEHDVKAVQESQTSMPDAINAAIDHVKTPGPEEREKIRDHHRHADVPAEDEERSA